jgi:hypothetical protein
MISKDKTYRTRDGREVRIYATDGGGGYLVHGAIYMDGWQAHVWSGDGESMQYFDDERAKHDLIEVKPRIKRTVWMNLYPEFDWWNVYSTKENADKFANDRIACVKVEIDCAEGEGL